MTIDTKTLENFKKILNSQIGVGPHVNEVVFAVCLTSTTSIPQLINQISELISLLAKYKQSLRIIYEEESELLKNSFEAQLSQIDAYSRIKKIESFLTFRKSEVWQNINLKMSYVLSNQTGENQEKQLIELRKKLNEQELSRLGLSVSSNKNTNELLAQKISKSKTLMLEKLTKDAINYILGSQGKISFLNVLNEKLTTQDLINLGFTTDELMHIANDPERQSRLLTAVIHAARGMSSFQLSEAATNYISKSVMPKLIESEQHFIETTIDTFSLMRQDDNDSTKDSSGKTLLLFAHQQPEFNKQSIKELSSLFCCNAKSLVLLPVKFIDEKSELKNNLTYLSNPNLTNTTGTLFNQTKNKSSAPINIITKRTSLNSDSENSGNTSDEDIDEKLRGLTESISNSIPKSKAMQYYCDTADTFTLLGITNTSPTGSPPKPNELLEPTVKFRKNFTS